MSTYDRDDVARAFDQIGARRGDVVFSHSNIAFFGLPHGQQSAAGAAETIVSGIFDAIGDKGTLVVPTFTYSFAKDQVFDREHSTSTCGAFAEAIRKRSAASRSSDPLFSVAAIGARATEFTADAPVECFGPNSVWARLITADALIANLNLDAGSTLVHHVEKRLGVPYRYDKTFSGTIVEDGAARGAQAIYFVRDLERPDTAPKFEPFDAEARRRGAARDARLGRGSIVAIRAPAVYELIESMLPVDPWFLTARAAAA